MANKINNVCYYKCDITGYASVVSAVEIGDQAILKAVWDLGKHYTNGDYWDVTGMCWALSCFMMDSKKTNSEETIHWHKPPISRKTRMFDGSGKYCAEMSGPISVTNPGAISRKINTAERMTIDGHTCYITLDVSIKMAISPVSLSTSDYTHRIFPNINLTGYVAESIKSIAK